MSFPDVMLAILVTCAFLVQLHYLRPVFAGRARAGVPAGFRTTAWFILTVWYSFLLLTVGDIPISPTATIGVGMLALAEIALTFTDGYP